MGLTIDGVVIHRPMGMLTFGDVNPWTIDELGGNYTVGVWCVMTVSFGGETESFITSFVQTTSGDWKWYGNRVPFRHGGDIDARANRRIQPAETADIFTGLELYLRDEGNLAWSNFGIDLILVFNDALPSYTDSDNNNYNSLVLRKRSDVETEYKIDNVTTSFWDHLYLECDGLDISSMDDSEYIFVGFTDGASPTPKHVWIDLLGAKPIKGSELSADDFPVITAPSTHDVSSLNIPGQVTVSWVNPAGKHGDWVSIWWGDSSDWTHMDVDNPAEDDPNLQFEDWTSCTFDTSSTTVYPPNYAGIQVDTNDEFDRDFCTIWEMD